MPSSTASIVPASIVQLHPRQKAELLRAYTSNISSSDKMLIRPGLHFSCSRKNCSTSFFRSPVLLFHRSVLFWVSPSPSLSVSCFVHFLAFIHLPETLRHFPENPIASSAFARLTGWVRPELSFANLPELISFRPALSRSRSLCLSLSPYFLSSEAVSPSVVSLSLFTVVLFSLSLLSSLLLLTSLSYPSITLSLSPFSVALFSSLPLLPSSLIPEITNFN